MPSIPQADNRHTSIPTDLKAASSVSLLVTAVVHFPVQALPLALYLANRTTRGIQEYAGVLNFTFSSILLANSLSGKSSFAEVSISLFHTALSTVDLAKHAFLQLKRARS